MKPSFALNITDTSIGLLHRTARGWLQVGETAFDTADLAEALGYLRGSALGLSPGGLTTKLVLPNSQIKYLQLDAPGPEDADRHNQIRAGLVGQTPYNVEDLVFDWFGTGPKVQVAVIARETLDEAEAFAAEHRFNPVSFVATPAKGDFDAEPWFGPTKLAASLLEKGEKVDRDKEPVQIATRDLPKSSPGAAKTAASAPAAGEEALAKDGSDIEKPTRAQRRAAAAAEQARAASAAAETDPAPGVDLPAPDLFPETALATPLAETDQPAGKAMGDVEPEHLAKAAVSDAALPAGTASVTQSTAFPEALDAENGLNRSVDTGDDLPPAPSAAIMAAFASRRAADHLPPHRPPAPAPSDPAPIDPTIALAKAVGNQALADRLSGKSAPPPLSRPGIAADSPTPSTPIAGDRSGNRRQSDPGQDVTLPSVLEAEPAATAAAVKPATAFVTAPSIPGSRKRKSVAAAGATVAGTPDPRKSLTKPGGTFASSKKAGKPRYLGLILTGLLLLFLALIAAWSSVVLGSKDAANNGTAVVSAPAPSDPATTDTVAVAPADPPVETATETAAEAAVPGVDDEMLADSQDPDAFETAAAPLDDPQIDPAADLGSTAAVGTDAALEDPAAAPQEVAIAAAPEPAPVGIATTDSPSAAPLDEAQDEIFLAAIDAPPLALDPLALPKLPDSDDTLPLPQLEPPPFGTVYQFDADGRIRPTPEGIITPAGVRLVAGKPSVTPPPRPAAILAAQPLPQTTQTPGGAIVADAPASAAPASAAPPTALAPADPALAEARPRARPQTTAVPASEQAGDGASIAVPGQTRLSGLRPQARPAAALAAGEAARQSTAAASLTAQAQQAAAVEAAVQAAFQPGPNTSPLAVAVSRRPAARPKDMTRAVEAAVAAAVRAPEPQTEQAQVEDDNEPEAPSAAPAIPTRASVAKQATYVNAINLSKINLIGVYGTKSSRYALVRQANGRYKKVKVGDTIDGGKVAAIGSDELRYQKSGRMVSLKLPKI